MERRARNSRWSREPKLKKAREPIVARLSEDDLTILNLLARYRYLPADYLAALTGRSLSALQSRLELLYRKPNAYLNRPHQQRANAGANTTRLIYELDDKGADELRARGFNCARKKYLRNFAHELMACTIAASFEIGANRTSALRIMGWQHLMSSPQMPEATKQLANPHVLTFEREGQRESLASDWGPFVVERNLRATSYAFVFGFEADCATEPLEAADSDRTSIRNKFLAYLSALDQDVPRRQFGATTFLIPFVTTTRARMHSMMALLQRLEPGAFGNRFLFKHVPSFTSFEKPAPATGHMLLEPWQRASFAPFSFAE